jgi:hypothetical protein
MRRAAPIVALSLALLVVALRPGAAQQEPFRPTAGRFVPGALEGGLLCVVDAYTGRLHLAPTGEAHGEAVKAWVVDLPEALMWERPLARDVSANIPMQHPLPLSGTGAGAPVFQWHPSAGAPGVLDTRSGAHYVLQGAPGPGCRVVRTDLRMISRSVREVRTRTE